MRNCNLNYAYKETPFSTYLTIRKSWTKNTQVHDESDHQVSEPVKKSCDKFHAAEENRNLSLKTELSDVKTQLETSKQIIRELESKAYRAEAEVYNQFKETNSGRRL